MKLRSMLRWLKMGAVCLVVVAWVLSPTNEPEIRLSEASCEEVAAALNESLLESFRVDSRGPVDRDSTYLYLMRYYLEHEASCQQPETPSNLGCTLTR